MKIRAIVVTTLTGLAGALLGAIAASLFWMSFANEHVFSSSEASISSRYSVLDQIRCGNVKAAVEFLELQMDGDLLVAAQMVRDGREESAGLRKLVAKEREARTKAGYQPTEPVLAKPVQEAIDLLADGMSASERH